MKLFVSRGQRKRIIVLFVELIHFYKQFSSLALNEKAQLLWGYFYEIEELAKRYGGEVQHFFWLRRVMVTFGARRSHFDDMDRALEFSLELKRLVEKWKKELEIGLDPILDFRIGISRGLVYYGEVGGEINAVTVIGDPVNLASRIVSIAKEGEIVFSGFEDYVPTGYVYYKDREVKVKGKEKPVEIFKLVSRSKDESFSIPFKFPFVGRKKELNLLKLSLNNYKKDRQRQKIAIIGEHGIGKTTLVKQFIKDSSLPVYYVSCHSRTATTHFKPIRELLKLVFRIKGYEKDSIIKSRINRVLSRFGGTLEEDAEIFHWFFSVKNAEKKLSHVSAYQKMQRLTHLTILLMKQISKDGAIFILDDSQMMDKTSLIFLKKAIDEEKIPAMFIFVTLPPGNEFIQKDNNLIINLEGLHPEESKKILESAGIFGRETIDMIIRLTEGNPFFIEEILRFKLANPDRKITREDILSSVYSVIMERIDTLPEELKSPLYLASIMGNSFPKEPFFKIIGESSPHILRRFEDAGILQIEDEYIRFTHSLIQEVAYRSILYADRKQYHGIVATMLEDLYNDRLEQFAESIAFHYMEAGNIKIGLRYTILAADKEKKSYFNEHALELYMEALRTIQEHGFETEKVPEIHHEIGNILNRLGDFDRAINHYSYALEEYRELSLVEPEVDTIEALGRVFTRKGDYQKAEKLFKEALNIAEKHEKVSLLARAYFEIGNLYSLKGEFTTALVNFNLGYNLLKEYSEEMIILLTHMAEMHYYTGNFKQAIELLHKALEKTEDFSNLIKIYTLLGRLYESVGAYNKSLESLKHALILSRKTGDKFLEIQSRAYLGGVQLHNESETAVKTLNHALESSEAMGDMQGNQVSLIYLAKYYLEEKKLSEAENYVLDAQKVCEILNNQFLTVYTMILSSLISVSVKKGKKALEMARNLRSPPLVLHALTALGNIYETKGEIKSAFENYKKASRMAKSLADLLPHELKKSFMQKRNIRRLFDKVQSLQ